MPQPTPRVHNLRSGCIPTACRSNETPAPIPDSVPSADIASSSSSIAPGVPLTLNNDGHTACQAGIFGPFVFAESNKTAVCRALNERVGGQMEWSGKRLSSWNFYSLAKKNLLQKSAAERLIAFLVALYGGSTDDLSSLLIIVLDKIAVNCISKAMLDQS